MDLLRVDHTENKMARILSVSARNKIKSAKKAVKKTIRKVAKNIKKASRGKKVFR